MRNYKYRVKKPNELQQKLDTDISYSPIGIIVRSIDHQVGDGISSVQLVPSKGYRKYQVSDKVLRDMYKEDIISLREGSR